MLLEVEGLCVNYGHIEAIRDITFGVEEGTVATLIGANGAGKTTTLKTISGLRKVREGRVVFDGKDITHIPPYERVKMGISQSPEGRGCFPGMTVRENLDMGAYVRNDRKSRGVHRGPRPGARRCSRGCASASAQIGRHACPVASSRCWRWVER